MVESTGAKIRVTVLQNNNQSVVPAAGPANQVNPSGLSWRTEDEGNTARRQIDKSITQVVEVDQVVFYRMAYMKMSDKIL